MSLTAALNVAVTSINSLNSAIRTVSNNVANAENEDYHAQQTKFANNRDGGVFVSDITRLVNDGLFSDLTAAISVTASSSVRDDYYTRLENQLGLTGTQSPLVDYAEALNTAWKTYEAAPESDAAERSVIMAAQNLTREIERISDALDTTEQSIHDDIVATVDDTNDILKEIDDLTDAIISNTAKRLPTSNLENLREAQLLKLSEIIDFDVINRDDGSIYVYSTSGLALVGAEEAQFTWNETAHQLTVTTSTSNNLITDNKLSDGKLKALLDLADPRDSSISDPDGRYNPVQKLRNQLDEFSYALVDDSTARHTGTVNLVNEAEPLANIGLNTGDQFTIAVGGGTTQTVTIGLGETVDDLITNISALPNVEARINGHGRLQILTSGEGFTIGNVGAGTALEDLGLTAGTYDADPATGQTLNYAYAEEHSIGDVNVAASATIAALPGVANGDTFDISVGGGATTTITITAADTPATLQGKLNDIDGVRAYYTNEGFLRISTVEGNLNLQENNNTPLAALGFQFSGATVEVENAAQAGEINRRFFEAKAGSDVTDISRINIRVNDVLVDGTQRLKNSAGSNVVSALSASNKDSFGSGLTLDEESYPGWIGAIYSDFNTRSSRYNRLNELDTNISNGLNEKLQNEVGVNVDEELTLLTVYQNSYAATARVISTVNQLFDTLQNVVR